MIILIKELFVVKKEYILYLIKRVNMKFYVKQRIVKKDVIYRFYDNYKFNGKFINSLICFFVLTSITSIILTTYALHGMKRQFHLAHNDFLRLGLLLQILCLNLVQIFLLTSLQAFRQFLMHPYDQ